ncbi:MAG: nitrogen regulation protein NR(II) [Gammaproteobacteria bacterium]|nr:nitrogen regulation protein NR(II) [Gammaproteobacteria bacterium]MDH5692564.1 nitrogen regulation protein NR(II) [Gammaproteobacteria bacterium]
MFDQNRFDINGSARQVIENLASAILLLDAELRLLYLNPNAESLFEISANQALNLNMAELFPADESWIKTLKKGLNSNQATTERELELHLPVSLKQIKIDCTISPYPDKSTPARLLIEVQQVDRKLRIAREEGLIAQQNAMKMLVRGFAHEVKNPLGGLRGAAQLLEKELHSEDLKEYTNIIIAEADRLQSLVNNMLGPNRPMKKIPTNIHEILERVRQLVMVESQNGLEVTRDYDPSIPDVAVDKDKIIQAVLNIAKNAVQALNGRGSLCFKTRTQRQFTIGNKRHRLVLKIDIIDNGPGIPPEIIDQIFYPLITGRSDGTGLGLTISQTLIGQHGGLIECESQPGNTVFTIMLPLE